VEFRQLKYFVQIATDQNYTIAAKNLHMTQPTLSWTIKQLEEELGIKLFVPNGKKLLLTAAGEELLVHARRLLSEQQQIIEHFQSRKNVLTGHIHLGIPSLFGSRFFIQPIVTFMEHYPQVKVTMYNSGSTTIQAMVESGKIDVGIVSYLTPAENLDAIKLPHITYPIVLVVSRSHRLATCPSVSFADLKDEAFILLEEGYTLGTLPIEACKQAGFNPKVVLRSSEWDVICEAVANSNTVSILPSLFLENANKANIAVIPLNAAETDIPIALITKKEQRQPLPVQKFIQFILDNVAVHA